MLKRSDFQDLLAPEPQDDGDPRGDIAPATDPKEFGLSVDVVADGEAPATAHESDCMEEWDAGEDGTLPPPREWLLGNQFCRKFLSGVLAPGATGKSAVRLLQFMALATGRPLSGQHVFQRARVLLVSLEDDRDELRRRLAAARLHHHVDLAELKGWLYCWTPKGIKLAEMKDNTRPLSNSAKPLQPAPPANRRQMQRHPPRIRSKRQHRPTAKNSRSENSKCRKASFPR